MSKSTTRPEPGCYHVWVFAEGGNAILRRRHCYSRTGANAFIARGLPGVNASREGKAALVLKCQKGCPCLPKCERGGHVPRPHPTDLLERRGQKRLVG